MIYCRSLLVYLSICAFGTRTRAKARARTMAGKNLQEKGVRKPLFFVKTPNKLPASSLSVRLARKFCLKEELEAISIVWLALET